MGLGCTSDDFVDIPFRKTMNLDERPYLVMDDGCRQPLRWPRALLGRARRLNDICFENDPAVSRQHAEIRERGGAFLIVNSSHVNPTRVNDEMVPPEGRVLKDADVIALGRTQITFRLSDPTQHQTNGA